MTENSRAHRCYLDTNVFILAFEKPTGSPAALADMFQSLRVNPGRSVTSELTLAELLAPSDSPMPADARRQLYAELLVGHAFVDLRPVTREVLLGTADLRQSMARKARLPDAIHLVTALQAGCSYVMPADKDMTHLPAGVTLVRPDVEGVAVILDKLRA